MRKIDSVIITYTWYYYIYEITIHMMVVSQVDGSVARCHRHPGRDEYLIKFPTPARAGPNAPVTSTGKVVGVMVWLGFGFYLTIEVSSPNLV